MTTSDLEVLLSGDELDGTLQTLLESIGRATAESIDGAHTRVDEFERRYGQEEYGREAVHALAEDEQQVVEHFLGLAFAMAQATYITPVVSRLIQLHRVAEWPRFATKLASTSGTKAELLQYGFQPGPKERYSKVEVIDAFANYYKHREEWDANWYCLEKRHQRTRDIIWSVGAHQSSTKNLRIGAEYLGNATHSDVLKLAAVLTPWRRAIVAAYRAEIRDKGLR